MHAVRTTENGYFEHVNILWLRIELRSQLRPSTVCQWYLRLCICDCSDTGVFGSFLVNIGSGCACVCGSDFVKHKACIFRSDVPTQKKINISKILAIKPRFGIQTHLENKFVLVLMT